jgi:hypothetical protein
VAIIYSKIDKNDHDSRTLTRRLTNSFAGAESSVSICGAEPETFFTGRFYDKLLT